MGSERGVLLTFFLIYTVALTFLGFYLSKKNTSGEEYLMGGRALSLPLLLGTTLATMVGTGSSMGAVGFGYNNGWAGSLYGIGGAIGMLLLVNLFGDARRKEFLTLSEELSYYYGANRAIRNLVSILIFIAEIGWLGAHILGGSMYFSWITGVPLTTAKLITALGFGLYTIAGGYLAVVYTDVIQAFVLFFGFVLLAALAVPAAGGYAAMKAALPPSFFSFLGLGKVGTLAGISLAVNIGVGVLATPSYRHRIYSGRSEETVRRSFTMTALLYAVFALLPAIIGMAARTLNPNLTKADMAFPFMVTEVFPVWIGAIVLLAGLSATMSSGDSDAIASVVILLSDVYPIIFGKNPPKDKVVKYSQIALSVTMVLAFSLTIFATSIISYITKMISTVLSGLFIAAFLGKFWRRATWQGGVAAMLGGSVTSLSIMNNANLMKVWGNPIIPALLGALLAGVVVSLVTPANKVSPEEALRILETQRAELKAGEEVKSQVRS